MYTITLNTFSPKEQLGRLTVSAWAEQWSSALNGTGSVTQYLGYAATVQLVTNASLHMVTQVLQAWNKTVTDVLYSIA